MNELKEKNNRSWLKMGTPKISANRQIAIPVSILGIKEGDDLIIMAELTTDKNGFAVETGKYRLEKI